MVVQNMMETSFLLREVEPGDLPQLNIWRNDKEIIDTLGSNFLHIAGPIDQQWYEGYLKNRTETVRLAIIHKASGDYIGNVNFTNMHPINRAAEFSIMIGDKRYWSKGIGTQVTRAMLAHGFEDLNLNRIYLKVLKNHRAAIRVYEKAGFALEGCLRESVYKNGEFKDLLSMAILRSEFFNLTQ